MSDKSMPAFPVQSVYIEDEPTNSRGMTLRQWYAGLAMQNIGDLITKPYNNLQSKAEIAYAMADAMLKAGEK